MKAVLKITDLRMSYIDGKEVLKGINMEIYPGEIIGYIGPNGAGKSTTIKILLGLLEYSEGSVEINGEKITPDMYEYKRKIGYVPESAALYENLSGNEYLEFVGSMFDLSAAEIESKSRNLSKVFNIEKNLDERISSYSKGMKQKLLIISSMIHNPDILIFDEPLNGMDANSVIIFKEVMSALAKRGKTILYSSHIMDVVEKISDRILLINDGEIVADGTFEELSKMNSDKSLESLFNRITGFNQYEELANDFVTSMMGGDVDD